jgi:hypothetical protein
MKMKRNNFTQTNILDFARMFGYGYCVINRNTLQLASLDKKVEIEIDRKNDSVICDGNVYKANRDKDEFGTLKPKDEVVKKYGDDFNPFCNVCSLYKWLFNE